MYSIKSISCRTERVTFALCDQKYAKLSAKTNGLQNEKLYYPVSCVPTVTTALSNNKVAAPPGAEGLATRVTL